jgi:hypothetical protein
MWVLVRAAPLDADGNHETTPGVMCRRVPTWRSNICREVALHPPTLSQGQTWSYTFSKAGTYSYICSIHPNMTGSITVT